MSENTCTNNFCSQKLFIIQTSLGTIRIEPENRWIRHVTKSLQTQKSSRNELFGARYSECDPESFWTLLVKQMLVL